VLERCDVFMCLFTSHAVLTYGVRVDYFVARCLFIGYYFPIRYTGHGFKEYILFSQCLTWHLVLSWLKVRFRLINFSGQLVGHVTVEKDCVLGSFELLHYSIVLNKVTLVTRVA